MLYSGLKFALSPLLTKLFRVKAEGLHHVPTSGGAILASNHLSFSDSVFLPLVVSRKIIFLGKSDYFTAPGIKGVLTRWFMRGIGALPVDRSGGAGGDASLQAGLSILHSERLLGIYPEGTRSPDGRLYRAKSGVARLAYEANVPVVPVAMIGTDIAQPTGQRIPKLHPISVRCGKPLYARDFFAPDALESEDALRQGARLMADELMRRVQQLGGQTYVDRYAADVKIELAAAQIDSQ